MKELTMNLRIELDDGIEHSMAREDRNVGFDMPALTEISNEFWLSFPVQVTPLS